LGTVWKTNEETPVQWLIPFPDMAEPCKDSLQLDGKYLYVNVKHDRAYSYFRWNIKDSYKPFQDWFWNYVYRPLDMDMVSSGNSTNPQYVVIPETTLIDEQSRIIPSVVLMNGDKLQAISTQTPDKDFIFSNQAVTPERILWEHPLSSYTILGLRYSSGHIYYMSREYPYSEEGCEKLNILDASTGELIKQWDLPLDDIPDPSRNGDFNARFKVHQHHTLYLIYYFPFYGESSPYPIYAFDMNTNTLIWKGSTFYGGCSGGFEDNGKLYFLDQEVDPTTTLKAFHLYGFDSRSGERTSPAQILKEDVPGIPEKMRKHPFNLDSPLLEGIGKYNFFIAGTDQSYFAAIHHDTMNVAWIKYRITGFTQSSKSETLFLVKEDRWIQKVNPRDGIVLQEWDIQAITKPEISLYRQKYLGLKMSLDHPEELDQYYTQGHGRIRNQLILSPDGILCAIYKEYIGGYSEKLNHRDSINLGPLSVYGVIAIDVSKPIESSNETES
jgi:outer membrane protein assembly factor BamB